MRPDACGRRSRDVVSSRSLGRGGRGLSAGCLGIETKGASGKDKVFTKEQLFQDVETSKKWLLRKQAYGELKLGAWPVKQ